MPRPICPKCGCHAEEVAMTSRVVCALNEDGSAGKVLRASKRIGQATYICGGGHKWTLTCKKCGTNLTKRGYCKDITCPFSDRQQHETYTEG